MNRRHFVIRILDFVHINSPIPDHAPMSIAALKAGKHVMCTVPMATSIDDCRKIVELVKKTGLKYMVAETCPITFRNSDLTGLHKWNRTAP
jgi:predicted dehydrogenase